MNKHCTLLNVCLHELEKSSTDIKLKMELETCFVHLRLLLLQNDSRLYSARSPCTINDLIQLLVLLRNWNKSAQSYVTESDVEAYAMGLIRLLGKE